MYSTIVGVQYLIGLINQLSVWQGSLSFLCVILIVTPSSYFHTLVTTMCFSGCCHVHTRLTSVNGTELFIEQVVL